MFNWGALEDLHDQVWLKKALDVFWHVIGNGLKPYHIHKTVSEISFSFDIDTEVNVNWMSRIEC